MRQPTQYHISTLEQDKVTTLGLPDYRKLHGVILRQQGVTIDPTDFGALRAALCATATHIEQHAISFTVEGYKPEWLTDTLVRLCKFYGAPQGGRILAKAMQFAECVSYLDIEKPKRYLALPYNVVTTKHMAFALSFTITNIKELGLLNC